MNLPHLPPKTTKDVCIDKGLKPVAIVLPGTVRCDILIPGS
jgi:hypothetical protein